MLKVTGGEGEEERVCVCVRERERERGRGEKTVKKSELIFVLCVEVKK